MSRRRGPPPMVRHGAPLLALAKAMKPYLGNKKAYSILTVDFLLIKNVVLIYQAATQPTQARAGGSHTE